MTATTRVLAALAALCAVGWWLDRGSSTSESVRQARHIWPALRLASVTAIDVGEAALTHGADGWKLADGRRADEARVAALLGALEFARVERHIALAPALGLKPPGKTLKIRAGDDSFVLHLGVRDLSRRFVYAQRAGEREALVLEASIDETSPARGLDWVARELVVDDISAARRLELGALQYERNARWVIAPRPGRAGARVEELFAASARLRAERVVACGARPAGVEVSTALGADGRKLAAVFAGAGACEGGALWSERGDGACLCLKTGEWRTLAAAARDPWLHELAPFSVDDVVALTFDAPGRAWTLERAEHRWVLRLAKTELDADDHAVRQWLGELLALQLDGAPDEPRPLTPKFSLELKSARDSVRLNLDGDRLARRFDETHVDHWRAPPELRALAAADARRLFRATPRAGSDKVAAPTKEPQ